MMLYSDKVWSLEYNVVDENMFDVFIYLFILIIYLFLENNRKKIKNQ